jgi:hypothetical protein
MKTLNVKMKITTTMKKNEAKKTKLLMVCYQRREIHSGADDDDASFLEMTP